MSTQFSIIVPKYLSTLVSIKDVQIIMSSKVSNKVPNSYQVIKQSSKLLLRQAYHNHMLEITHCAPLRASIC